MEDDRCRVTGLPVSGLFGFDWRGTVLDPKAAVSRSVSTETEWREWIERMARSDARFAQSLGMELEGD